MKKMLKPPSSSLQPWGIIVFFIFYFSSFVPEVRAFARVREIVLFAGGSNTVRSFSVFSPPLCTLLVLDGTAPIHQGSFLFQRLDVSGAVVSGALVSISSNPANLSLFEVPPSLHSHWDQAVCWAPCFVAHPWQPFISKNQTGWAMD